MKNSETTNGALERVCAEVDVLIGWAVSDAQHAEESDAPTTARDDRRRAKTLRYVLKLLRECKR